MFKHLNTYRQFVLALVIVSYCFTVFQKPVFEVLHLLYHAPGIVLSGVKVHSFESHDNKIHQHGTLAKLDIQSDEQDQPSPVNNIQEIKKKVEIADKFTEPALENSSPTFNNFRVILPFKSALKEVLSPPPQHIA